MSDLPRFRFTGPDAKTYQADLETMQRWIRDGMVSPEQQFFDAEAHKHVTADRVPELAKFIPPPRPQMQQQAPPPAPVVPQRNAARGSCGLAIAAVLFSVLLGMLGIKGLSVIAMMAAFVFLCAAGL